MCTDDCFADKYCGSTPLLLISDEPMPRRLLCLCLVDLFAVQSFLKKLWMNFFVEFLEAISIGTRDSQIQG